MVPPHPVSEFSIWNGQKDPWSCLLGSPSAQLGEHGLQTRLFFFLWFSSSAVCGCKAIWNAWQLSRDAVSQRSQDFLLHFHLSRRREKYLKEQDSSCYRWSYKSIPHNSPEILSRVSCRFHYILSLRFLLLRMIIFFNCTCEDISCKGFPQQTGPSLFPHWQSKGRRYLCDCLEP